MSEHPDARFFLTALEITFPDAKFSAEALVSPFGISRLVLPIGLANGNSRGRASFEDFSADILLLKQHTETGTSFAARFDGLTDEQADYLREKVAREGVPPAWVRRYPRIAVANLDEEENPHPSFCLLPWQGKDYKLKVVNFTVGGLRVSYNGELAGLRVGSIATISVYGSSGAAISGLEVEVKNFCLLEGGNPAVTEIGFSFTDPRSLANESYRALIRDCLISLKPGNR